MGTDHLLCLHTGGDGKELCKEYLQHNRGILNLGRSFSMGRAERDGDFLDTSTIDVQCIDDALILTTSDRNIYFSNGEWHALKEQGVPPLDDKTRQFLDSSLSVKELRLALANSHWDVVRTLLDERRNGKLNLVPICEDEFDYARIALSTRTCLEKLRTAVSESDIKALQEWTVKAEELNSSDSRVVEYVDWAKACMAQMEVLDNACTQARASKDPEHLRGVLDSCAKYNFRNTNVKNASTLYFSMLKIEAQAEGKSSSFIFFSPSLFFLCVCVFVCFFFLS